MKHSSKNLSYKIRSIEDAIEFDDDTLFEKYEQIATTKKQIIDELELLNKKKIKEKEHRKTQLFFDGEF